MAQERGGLFPRLAPTFPGPIGNPKAGIQKRCSFMTTDPETGKAIRGFHKRDMQVALKPNRDVSGLGMK